MAKEPLKITAIQQDQLLEILRKSGSREVSAETIATDIAAGAPVADDGTINMIEYAAWLLKEASRGI
ncbi:MAG: hypothetical protein PVH19_01630 [Planctomycetia bacterium]